jgi:hypothetical protein
MIAKHEMVLKSLLDSHPGNKGLERAYNNSQKLIGKFEEKVNRTEYSNNETGNETGEVLNKDKKEENSVNRRNSGNSGNSSGNSGNSDNSGNSVNRENNGNSGNSGNKRTR